MPSRIYTDTSVLGGCEDPEFSIYSLQLLEAFVQGTLTLVLSDLTLQELSMAPAKVRQHVTRVPEHHLELIALDEEAMELADSYLAAGVISPKMRADAQHIAMATVHRTQVVVSWNFKHIVNLRRIYGYNSVNKRQGYPVIEIRTPREVLS